MATRQSVAGFRWPGFGTGWVLMQGSVVRQVRFPGSPLSQAFNFALLCGAGEGEAGRVARMLEDWLAGKGPWPVVEADLGLLAPFSRKVLEACLEVPPGEVCTYGELARRAGRPGAARAAGNALAQNPAPLVVPCHRVSPSGGGLGNYQGGGELKRWLRELETR